MTIPYYMIYSDYGIYMYIYLEPLFLGAPTFKNEGHRGSRLYIVYILIGHMGVSKNNGTPKSSILIGFSIINHPFWGTPIFGNTHMSLDVPHFFWPIYLPTEKIASRVRRNIRARFRTHTVLAGAAVLWRFRAVGGCRT